MDRLIRYLDVGVIETQDGNYNQRYALDLNIMRHARVYLMCAISKKLYRIINFYVHMMSRATECNFPIQLVETIERWIIK